MSFTKIWVHCVWTTKNRNPYLKDNIRQKVFDHILENGNAKDIYVDRVNGHLEHVHCLLILKRNQNIADCLQLLKGESSFWINSNKLCPHKFIWQDDYFAVSIGQSQVNTVRKYIDNQEKHHSKKSFANEYEEFIQKYGFE